MLEPEDRQTHFGYQQVAWEKKAEKVKAVFDSVASQYDLMNDLMSLGIHRLWKRYTIAKANVKKGQIVLDLAGGTGDLAQQFQEKVGPTGLVVLADINASMLEKGRARMIDSGKITSITYSQVDAQALPYKDNTFDCITIAFGLRNVTDKQQALHSMYRTLKPGGRLLILEFSKPKHAPIQAVYDLYSFSILPWLGKVVADDAQSYQYLAESIRMHPCQETLRNMILKAGFDECHYENLTGGIVALHIAYKY